MIVLVEEQQLKGFWFSAFYNAGSIWVSVLIVALLTTFPFSVIAYVSSLQKIWSIFVKIRLLLKACRAHGRMCICLLDASRICVVVYRTRLEDICAHRAQSSYTGRPSKQPSTSYQKHVLTQKACTFLVKYIQICQSLQLPFFDSC